MPRPVRLFVLTFWPEQRLIAPAGANPGKTRAVAGVQPAPGDKMNKADLIDRVAAGTKISKSQAATAIDTLVESVTGALRKGDRVALIGFGTFSVSQRKARNGRNPQTGTVIKIAARKVAKFTPGAELRKAVNKK
jgi:DNA-binding protein HU-beta